jgi:hypothetical protein
MVGEAGFFEQLPTPGGSACEVEADVRARSRRGWRLADSILG